MNVWPFVKSLAAHTAGDFAYQSRWMACNKLHNADARRAHVAVVAMSHLAAAATTETAVWRMLVYVAVNALVHERVDSVRMHKALDQALHIVVALASAALLR